MDKSDTRMRKKLKNKKKDKLLTELSAAKGIVSIACLKAGVSRSTFYDWMDADDEFRKAVDDIQEEQVDFVESKFLDLIDEGDAQSSIFYLKTKGKKRGYTERDIPSTNNRPSADTASDANTTTLERVQQKIEELKTTLRQQGGNPDAYTIQISITAQLWVKTEDLFQQTLSRNPVNVQISREGNERETISATETLYCQYADRLQSALRSLGLTSDAKKIETEDKFFDDFYNDLNND